MRTIIAVATAGGLALAMGACRDRAEPPAAGLQEPQAANGALSPAGDRHPGDIVHDDRVDKRVWTQRADAVPGTIAWVRSEGKWLPVVRIQITGTAARREITRFGPGGRFLDTTVQGPPPPTHRAPAPDGRAAAPALPAPSQAPDQKPSKAGTGAGFCGKSTLGACSADSDCAAGGCSGQICQAKSEPESFSTCEFKSCYDAKAYGLACRCEQKACQWAKAPGGR